jgi:adenylate kinase family enzyme
MRTLALPQVMFERIMERGKTSGRADDNATAIRQRLDTFHGQTTPVVDYYQAKSKVKQVEADGALKEVREKKLL